MLESVLPLWTDIWGSNLQWMDLLWSSTPQVLEYLTKNYSNLQTDRTVFPRWYFDMYSITIDYIYQTYLPDIFTTYFPLFDLFWVATSPGHAQTAAERFAVLAPSSEKSRRLWVPWIPDPDLGYHHFRKPPTGVYHVTGSKKWWWTTDDSRRSKSWRSVETIVPRTPTETAAGGMNGSTVAVNSGKRPAIVALDSGKRPAILKARLRLRYLELCVALTSFGWNMLT